MKGAFLIPNNQESAISFCDLGCYNVYTFYVDINPLMGKKLKPNPSVCYYCIACGRRIYKTIDCMIHDDKCPDWLWYSSYPIMSDFLDIIEEETGKRDCSDIIFDTADRIAKKNQLISGTDLGLMTLDSL
jgi:hypothetical protein